MRKFLVSCALIGGMVVISLPVTAQTVPNNTQNTQSQAVSNPVGSNTNVQNNLNYSGVNAFGPGMQCATPYVSSSLFRNDLTFGNIAGSGQNNTGAALQLVVPIGGASNKVCQELATEILTQRQLDTCLNVRRAGFKFDPKEYPEEAKRCNALIFDPSVIPNTNVQQVSPPQPPTVITVPSGPTVPGAPHTVAPDNRTALSAVPVPSIVVYATPKPVAFDVAKFAPVPEQKRCAALSDVRKAALVKALRNHRDPNRKAYLDELQAGCVSLAQVVSAL